MVIPPLTPLKLVANHEQLITELVKSISRIGDVLPRIDLHLHLYPTAAMKHAIEDLYAQLISFYQRALRWYEARPFKHVIKAIFKPYPLQFQDIVECIQYRARHIESLAIVLAHKEIREMYLLVKECLKEQKTVQTKQRAIQSGQDRFQSALADVEQSRTQKNALLLDLERLLTCKSRISSVYALLTSL